MIRTKHDQSQQSPSDHLLELVQPYEFAVIVLHDTPDADAIASGWAIKHLLDEQSLCDARLIAGGELLRSENRRMMELLKPPLVMLDEYRLLSEVALIFVDCGPEASEHIVDKQLFDPIAVIHHHEMPDVDAMEPASLPLLHDVRLGVAATSVISATYLFEQDLEPSEGLATALLYGIREETRGRVPRYSDTDRKMIEWLTSRANLGLISEIENSPLPSRYFADFALALQSCVIFDDAAFCVLPRTSCAETVGEVADFLIRHESINRVLTAAAYQQSVIVCVRTETHIGDATKLMRSTIDGIGRGAGHGHRAGGRLFRTVGESTVPIDTQNDLLVRWLSACNINRRPGQPLLTHQQITSSLEESRVSEAFGQSPSEA